MVDGIFSILAADYFTFLPGLPRTSQKGKLWSQYKISVDFCMVPLFWILISGLYRLYTWLHLFYCYHKVSCVNLPHKLSSVAQIPVPHTTSIYQDVDAASKWYKACFTYEVPPLNLYGDISIGNGNYLTIATTDWAMKVPYTGPTLQAYSSKNTPRNHWWRLPLSADFIFCTLFEYLWNPSFIIFFLIAPCNCMYWY